MKAERAPVELVDDTPPPPDAEARLKRVRALAWFLDRLFSLGGNRRFGVEPLIGLIPGLGDWIGGALSLYILYEGARLGLSWRVLGQMGFNIFVEAIVGTVPVAGDIIDFFWQANMRNVQLIERHYAPRLKPRPLGRIVLLIGLAAFLLTFLLITMAFLVARWIWSFISQHPW